MWGWIFLKIASLSGVIIKWKWLVRFSKLCNWGPPHCSVLKSYSLLLKDGLLFTCWERVEDVLIEFPSPLSDLYKIFGPPLKLQKKTPLHQNALYFHPISLLLDKVLGPLPHVFHPVPWKNTVKALLSSMGLLYFLWSWRGTY